ncbi:ATP-binding protein [Marinobacterium mangrovicola]|uniref:histidine kinase n=1 Tax=Marinobacterium mangrovicola TaxID=1476959 RepID=A0A4R1GBF6_9GAMM|nr:ATP-binding protein [Marinobacterium mangrovicola]TCK04051.1 phospho-acceptor domain-containing protein [Marinobacterium mangrovicola]
MKRRAAILLTLLVVLPLLLLGWLGFKFQQNEQELVGLQLQKLIEQQLESVDNQLQTHFQQLEILLQRQADSLYRLADPDYPSNRLRNFVFGSGQVQQLFVLDQNDQRLFPPLDTPLNAGEQRLVDVLEPLWSSPGLFHPGQPGSPVSNEVAPAQMEELRAAPSLSKSAEYFATGQLAQRAPAELSAPMSDYADSQVMKSADSAKIEIADSGKKESAANDGADSDSAVAAQPSAEAEAEIASRGSFSSRQSAEQLAAAPEPQLRSDLEGNALLESAAQPEGESASGEESSGWISWYVDSRLMHIFWWRDPVGRTLGFVLDPGRLQADLIARLPDQQQGIEELGDAQIRLLNSRNENIYSWGDYAGDGPALRSLGLNHPLGSWRLEYHGPGLQRATPSLWLTLAAPLVLLGLGLTGLGYLLYREQKRESLLARQRVNFVNQVSHELKTPLTNVRLYAEMLEQRLEGEADPATGRYLGVITDESQRLSRLIDNVLSFSRLQRQQLKLSPQLADPDEQISRVLGTFAPLLRQRGIEPLFEPGIGTSQHYDSAALEQILNNLLSNCEKYAPDSGELKLSSWMEGSMLSIQVQDNGPGIEDSERERVFDPFYRSSSRLTDGVSGTGIGLGLARDLARAHGGELSLERCEKGACFTIRLETGR